MSCYNTIAGLNQSVTFFKCLINMSLINVLGQNMRIIGVIERIIGGNFEHKRKE